MRCITDAITESTLRRYAGTNVWQITHPSQPVKFRFHSSRKTGTWYLVINKNGRQSWESLAQWPALKPRELFEKLPAILAARLAGDSDAGVLQRHRTVGEVLAWYGGRVALMRSLSKERRAGIKSVIQCHLMPLVGDMAIDDITHDSIDNLLFMPLQARLSPAYCRQIFSVLAAAFKQAHKMRQIKTNTLAGIGFSDFGAAAIKPREGRLRGVDILRVVDSINNAAQAAAQCLVLFMLMYGTRIGETRRLRWKNINFSDRVIYIPADDAKTREGLRIYLTEVSAAMLHGWRGWQKLHGYDGDFVFPNHRGQCIGKTCAGGLVVSVSRGKFTAHDLRKFARSVWADIGIDYMVAERLLNHKLKGLDQVYIHSTVEEGKRAALKKYHAWLKENGLKLIDTGFYATK